jgi:hypothetical protein
MHVSADQIINSTITPKFSNENTKKVKLIDEERERERERELQLNSSNNKNIKNMSKSAFDYEKTQS